MFAIGFNSYILPSFTLHHPLHRIFLIDSHTHVLHCCRFRLLGFFLCRPVSTCRPWVCLDSYRSTPSSNTASHPSLSHVCVHVCACKHNLSSYTYMYLTSLLSIPIIIRSHALTHHLTSHASHRPHLPCQAIVLLSSGPCANRIGHHDITGLCGSLQRPILLFVVLCDV
jgi:hypothetical protein